MELSEKKRAALEYLKSQNWYKIYMENWGVGVDYYRNISHSQFFSQELVRFWITCPIEWTATSQGCSYWDKIHTEWYLKYKDYGA